MMRKQLLVMAALAVTPVCFAYAQSGSTGLHATSIPSNMSAKDFNSFVRGRWDRDGNGLISQTEWGNVGINWYGTERIDPFSTYDTNASGALEVGELNTAISTSRLYQRYDLNGDGAIDKNEEARIPRQ